MSDNLDKLPCHVLCNATDFRYYIRTDEDWEGGGGDKIARLTSMQTAEWAQAMIAHTWSGINSGADYLVAEPVRGTDAEGNLLSTHWNDFEHHFYFGGQPSQTPIFDRDHAGKWHGIEARVKLNDPGQSNGIFEVWIDDRLEMSRRDLNWIGSYEIGPGAGYGLNWFALENYWNAGTPKDQSRYFDNLVISRSKIGLAMLPDEPGGSDPPDDSDPPGSPSAPAGGTTGTPAETSRMAEIAPGQSGKLEWQGELSIEVPAGASDERLKLEAKKIADLMGLVDDPEDLLSSVYELLANVSGRFDRPVTIKLAYEADRLPEGKVPSIYYYDEMAERWVKVGGTAKDGFVAAEVDHFTKFAVFAEAKEQAAPALADADGHWAEAAIRLAAREGWLTPAADGRFLPDRAVTRAEFTAALMQVLALEGIGLADEGGSAFPDLKGLSGETADAIESARRAGIVAGYGDGSFRPADPLVRAEMAMLLLRAAEVRSGKAETAASRTPYGDDGNIPSWAKTAIAYATGQGLLTGRPGNVIDALAPATRAETAKVLENWLNSAL